MSYDLWRVENGGDTLYILANSSQEELIFKKKRIANERRERRKYLKAIKCNKEMDRNNKIRNYDCSRERERERERVVSKHALIEIKILSHFEIHTINISNSPCFALFCCVCVWLIILLTCVFQYERAREFFVFFN